MARLLLIASLGARGAASLGAPPPPPPDSSMMQFGAAVDKTNASQQAGTPPVYTYVKSPGYCLDLCGTDLMDWWTLSSDTPRTYAAYAAACDANDDCIGFGDHYDFDRYYLKSRLAMNTAVANCNLGVGISTGNYAIINNCYKKVVSATPSPTGSPTFSPTSFPTPSPTVSPTSSPTSSPTQATPPSAGGAGAGASAIGDPHLQNIHGQRFDLMKAGKHVLINIPRGMAADQALLRVQAEVRRMGGHCADMYFQELNVTGSWAEAKQAGGYHYSVSQRYVKTPTWVAFGRVELKVVHGRTASGLLYLNIYVKHLGRAGFAVGGLLGEDDHGEESTPPDACHQRTALVAGSNGGPRVASAAAASLQ
ncbi:unnamed protein product [Prorocentrum cordatum]|uniref:Subtilisin n=1 Tax=Prorocentrum cordatum TaxID=2364126 RepID=A0ABN9RHV6_9DINO|nr:unnamed protein product [Polarella glacialis]